MENCPQLLIQTTDIILMLNDELLSVKERQCQGEERDNKRPFSEAEK